MSDHAMPPLATWDEYRGQPRLKSRLMVHAEAALNQERMLDDVLFAGPPGTGKTTLARLLANLVNDPFKLFMVPQIDIKHFCQFCRRWEGGVILLDEMHAAPRKLSELLYTAIGQDNKVLHPASGAPIDVNHITFMAATTEPDKLHKPLWDRFKIKPRWEDYTDDDMALIVSDGARRVGVRLSKPVVAGLARATGGTPRLANSLVSACRDLQATGGEVSVETVLDLVGVDPDGLSERHIDYLQALDTLNGSSGLRNLRSLLRLSSAAIEDLERLLIQRGMVSLEPTGRSLTAVGERKLPGATTQPSVRKRRAS